MDYRGALPPTPGSEPGSELESEQQKLEKVFNSGVRLTHLIENFLFVFYLEFKTQNR